MAGHKEALLKRTKVYLAKPKMQDIAANEIYGTAHQLACPVCGAQYDRLKYAVPWGPEGAQEIFTCSLEHAQEVYNYPERYLAAVVSKNGFCDAGSLPEPQGAAMYNGFQVGFGEDSVCALILFKAFVLTSQVKYAFAFIGVILLGMSFELLGMLRESIQRLLYRKYGWTICHASYATLETPCKVCPNSKKLVNDEFANTAMSSYRQIPFWCKAVLAGMYMLAITIAYMLMLIIMMYETLYFLAVIIGLGIGFALFKDIETEDMGGNVDPCCSS